MNGVFLKKTPDWEPDSDANLEQVCLLQTAETDERNVVHRGYVLITPTEWRGVTCRHTPPAGTCPP